ncbi:MAG: MFS transporter [Clostridia bacterium]|nr:MFS transporter [Clostridia bacterium]
MFGLLLALIYVCFISLGLPDSLLGSAWPVLHQDINVPVSFAGVISVAIFICTIISSLFSDKLSRKLGSGLVTAISVSLTAVALFGFSISNSFWMLLMWAIPYGFGAGGVDAVLNNYVALHYKAQHMSWLHCFWGIGASISPYIMSFSLIKLDSWSKGYLFVSIIQIILSVFLFMSLPIWKKGDSEGSSDETESAAPSLSFKQIFSIRGALQCFFLFFGYCSLELTTSLWASSYLVENRGIDPETASAFASLFYIGITLGRGINGFLAMKFSDRTLIRTGLGIITLGIILVFMPFHDLFALCGFVVIGLGCAPVYPCIIHMTPDVFGRDKSQAMIGIQMAFAYTGFCIVPPLFGVIAQYVTIALLPPYLLVFLVVMAIMHETMIIKTRK